jgi:hypothetical protein
MSTILSVADYPSIRSVLDFSIDDAVLPDSVIAQPMFAPAADLAIQSRVTGALTATGAAAAHVKNAAIYWAAALLCPYLPDITLETFGDYNYRRRPVVWLDRRDFLLSRALEEVQLANGDDPDLTALQPTSFTTAPATRGR